MQPVTSKITSEQVEEFWGYVQKWQNALHLHRWRIEPTTKKTKNCAECDFDSDDSARLVKIRLGTNFGSTPIDSNSLETLAIHEVLHVFVKDYKDICTTKPHDSDSQMWHEHEMIHVLEKLFMELSHALRPKTLPAD